MNPSYYKSCTRGYFDAERLPASQWVAARFCQKAHGARTCSERNTTEIYSFVSSHVAYVESSTFHSSDTVHIQKLVPQSSSLPRQTLRLETPLNTLSMSPIDNTCSARWYRSNSSGENGLVVAFTLS